MEVLAAEDVASVNAKEEVVCDNIKEEVTDEDKSSDPPEAVLECEQLVVKADPEDYTGLDDRGEGSHISERGEGSSRQPGIVIRSDLLNSGNPRGHPPGPLYGERGRCHFCSLLCPGRYGWEE